MSDKPLRAPFPYFGGKRHAAPLVWQALGNAASYCEPFCGSAAVLLARPGGPGRIETVNDIDGHVANFWRAVRSRPEEVARHLDYPVIENDLHARHRWLMSRLPEQVAALDADPEWCDPKAAGWWAWGACAWIGSGWCTERRSRKLPHLGDTGRGVHAVPPKKLPHIGHAGMGVHAVPPKQLPHLSNTGAGVHAVPPPLAGDEDEADITPHLLAWMRALSVRLRRVRVACGDFRRVVTHSALCESMVGGRVGIFYDPPYGEGTAVYGKNDSKDIAADVASLAAEQAREHPTWRIVVAGYEGQHEAALDGWRIVAWDADAGWSSGGYGRKNGNPQRERLWLSPACLPVEQEAPSPAAQAPSQSPTPPPSLATDRRQGELFEGL